MQHDLIQPPLLDEIKKYLNQIKNNEKVYLFVPYIKTKSLEKLIDGINNEIVIVTNWKENNFLTGSAELSLYPFCNERGIKLYNNEKIHLKVYSINLDSMILATGNISQRGLMPNGNLELGTLIEKISHKDRQFFEQIIQDSSIIDEELYRSREKYLEENRHLKELIEPITIEKDPKDEFLISALPMTRNIAILKNSYDKLNRNMPASNDQEINGCVDADLENYGIPLQLSPDEFEKLLKKKFFEHPFIQRIDKFLTPCGQFGEIKQWIQDNCTDVPIPSRRELTGNVQVLLEWFVKLGDGTYEMDVPGAHSQRLCKKISNELEYQNHSDDEIRNAVLLGLSMPGRTVTEIENEIGRTFSGVNEQKSNRDLSSWHNITEIVLFAAKELNIPDELRLERYPSRPNDDYGPFYMLIVRHIRELRRAGRLIDWDYPRSGIWCLKENIPKTSGRKWIWSTTKDNWKILNEKNIWASKKPLDKITEKISPGDKVIFYVMSTGEFQGIFEFDGDWYPATAPVWADEINKIIYISQIKIKKIATGHINTYEHAKNISFFPTDATTPEGKTKNNNRLQSGNGFPSNSSKPIPDEDYNYILEKMSVTIN
tara:strand:+ start:3594 stop:5393 length:1800 start_codon:yes stop_codon:yes gene_type:complete